MISLVADPEAGFPEKCRWATLSILALFSMTAGGDLSAESKAALLDWKAVLAEGSLADPSGTEPWDISYGSFSMDSEMPFEPMVMCYYATPAAQGRRMSPRRSDAVYYFHTPDPKKANIVDNDLCHQLVSKLGMTVFGISFQASSSVSLYFGDKISHDRFYAFSQSGSFKTMLSAWAKVRRHLDIDATRFFLYGYSAGGIGVQRFAEEYPEFCAGMVSVNGHTFVEKNGAGCPALILHSYGDAGVLPGFGLFEYYQQIGTPCIRLMTSPNWNRLKAGDDFAFHALNPHVTALTMEFLRGPLGPALASWPSAAAAGLALCHRRRESSNHSCHRRTEMV